MKNIKEVAPDIKGPMGCAWISDIEGMKKNHPDGPPKELTVASYIVQAAWAHPLWSNYATACVSLHDIEGVPPARILLEGATHEVLVVALDPSKEVYLDEYYSVLTPLNFAGQFKAVDDAEAKQRTLNAVLEVLNGTLSPDTDFISQWVQRFSGANLRKAYEEVSHEGHTVH